MPSVACFLLLLVCCLGTLEQIPKQRKINYEEYIHFQTKGKYVCSMLIKERSRIHVKLWCRNKQQISSCEYSGKPELCEVFVSNLTLYWNQVLLDLQGMSEPCLDVPVLGPPECQDAELEAQINQDTSSFKPLSEYFRALKQDSENAHISQGSPEKVETVKPTVLPPEKATEKEQLSHEEDPKEEATKTAKDYCWKPLQSICSFFFSMFQR